MASAEVTGALLFDKILDCFPFFICTGTYLFTCLNAEMAVMRLDIAF